MTNTSKDRRAIFNHLKNEPLANIYFIYGDDSYMLDSAVEAVVEKALPGEKNNCNFFQYRGESLDSNELLSTCEMTTLLSPQKVVVVRDLQDAKAEQVDALVDYLADPSPSTYLILHTNTTNKSLDGRKKGVKAIKKYAKEFELKSYYENELPDVVLREGRRRGIELSREAVGYLISAVGTQLGDLYSGIEKVSLFLNASLKSKNTIPASLQDVSTIVAETQIRNVFKLTEALGKRDLENACQILEGMNRAGEPILRISTMIARHFRILLRLHDPSIRTLPQGDKAAAVGVNSYFLRDYLRDTHNFSAERCNHILHQLLILDQTLKSTNVSDLIAMEELLFSICLQK